MKTVFILHICDGSENIWQNTSIVQRKVHLPLARGQ